MEDKLNMFENGRWPKFFEMGRQPQIFWTTIKKIASMEDYLKIFRLEYLNNHILDLPQLKPRGPNQKGKLL
jgi:hypothetical protein